MAFNIADITIRPLAETDSIEELTELLHRGYKVLADMGLNYMASYQDADRTRKRISYGECFVVVHDNRIIGTINFYMPEAVGGSPWLNREDVCEFGQFTVEPEYQGHGIGGMMVKFVEDLARSRGIAEICLNTSDKAFHLIDWYQRLGYRFIEHVDWKPTNYLSVILSKSLSTPNSGEPE